MKKNPSPQKTNHLDKRAEVLVEIGASDPDDLLTEAELAAWFGVSKSWVVGARSRGTGPPYKALDDLHVIRYQRGDARTWLKSRTRTRARKYKARRNRSGAET